MLLTPSFALIKACHEPNNFKALVFQSAPVFQLDPTRFQLKFGGEFMFLENNYEGIDLYLRVNAGFAKSQE